MTDPVRIGILSTANIARVAVGPAIRASGNAEIAAVASRDVERARAFAEPLGVSRVHGSYDALLEEPDVDAVYIALPNALHEEWTIRALEAGKHVLCEKPLAPTEAACRRMSTAADRAGLVLMEAFMYRFHPRIAAAVEAVREGRIGRPAFLDATFTFRVRSPENIRFSRELAGGALLDVGCYTVDVARRLLGEDPVVVTALARFDGDRGVDLESAGLLRFPSGAVASVTSGLTLPRREVAEVRGTSGTLRLDRAFLPGAAPTRLSIVDDEGDESERSFAGNDPYRIMVEAFADRAQGRSDAGVARSDAEEAAGTARILEALEASARGGGGAVELEPAA